VRVAAAEFECGKRTLATVCSWPDSGAREPQLLGGQLEP